MQYTSSWMQTSKEHIPLIEEAFAQQRRERPKLYVSYLAEPGIADFLNQYMSEKCREFEGRVTGMATVFPGEPGADSILRRAFAAGLPFGFVRAFCGFSLGRWACVRFGSGPMSVRLCFGSGLLGSGFRGGDLYS